MKILPNYALISRWCETCTGRKQKIKQLKKTFHQQENRW